MPESLTFWHACFAAVVIFFAYLVRGIAGFGSALVAVPLLVLVLPLQTVVPVVVAVDYVAALTQSTRDRPAIRWRDIWPLFPFSLAGVVSALYLFRQIDTALLVKLLGLFIVGFALYSLSPVSAPVKRGRGWAAPAGFMGGLIGALFGTGGPFYVIYLRLRQLDKRGFRATTAAIFVIDGGLRLAGFWITGLLGLKGVLLVLLALPLKFLGLRLGHRVHERLDEKSFMRFISLLLCLSGLMLLFKGG